MRDGCFCFYFEMREDELLRIEEPVGGIGIPLDLVFIPQEIMVIGALVRRAMIAFLLSNWNFKNITCIHQQ